MNHKKMGNAVSKQNAYITTKRGARRLRQTTIGWRFMCNWKDGTSSWVPLKVLKESNPVEVAEYVTALGLADEPAFAWWVPYTLKKRDRIIASVQTRVKKRERKYGIQIPRTIKEAKILDERNGVIFHILKRPSSFYGIRILELNINIMRVLLCLSIRVLYI